MTVIEWAYVLWPSHQGKRDYVQFSEHLTLRRQREREREEKRKKRESECSIHARMHEHRIERKGEKTKKKKSREREKEKSRAKGCWYDCCRFVNGSSILAPSFSFSLFLYPTDYASFFLRALIECCQSSIICMPYIDILDKLIHIFSGSSFVDGNLLWYVFRQMWIWVSFVFFCFIIFFLSNKTIKRVDMIGEVFCLKEKNFSNRRKVDDCLHLVFFFSFFFFYSSQILTWPDQALRLNHIDRRSN